MRLRTAEQIGKALAAAQATVELRPQEALIHLHAVLAVRPGDAQAITILEAALAALGEDASVERARALAEGAALDHPALRHAAQMIEARALIDADTALTRFLHNFPEDPPAMRMLANVHDLARRPREAEALLRRALALAPGFASVRDQLIENLLKQGKIIEALTELDLVLAERPASLPHLKSKAAILRRQRRTDEAAALYERIIAAHPDDADVLADYGNLLRGAGRTDEAIAAFRAACRDPRMGRGWWALADLKTLDFSADDIATMQAALLADDLTTASRIALHFALGRALDGHGRHAEAFAHLADGNALQRGELPFDIRRVEDHARRQAAVLRHGVAGMAPAHASGVIFVIGMPRSGSTLVEQILASHPAIEATEELPYLGSIANMLADLGGPGGYPEGLLRMSDDRRAHLRERYLSHAHEHLSQGRPLFIDKNPTNWQHIGLIQAILPDALIVDVRRHPLDCGFSIYQQLFGKAHDFAYSLDAIGRFYRAYVEQLRVVDEILPGRVHRIIYERLVADPEGEVRRLLDHAGLVYDPACLDFHQARRPVYSASSEQVRRSVNSDGIGRAKAYAAWLGPLRAALGPVLEAYPDPPR